MICWSALSQTFTDYDAAALPAAVLAYLDARDADRWAEAAALFTADAVVVDDGRTYTGTEAISRWIVESSTEFEYTATRTAQDLSAGRIDVQIRLDGSFPGGTVSLRYAFEVDQGAIRSLSIDV